MMKEKDCSIKRPGAWFRYRAAGIIIEEDCVLFAGNNADDYYYSVGGAVQIGETAQQAAEREVFEETGVHYQSERLLFVHENFFAGSGTLKDYETCHELTMYYLMKSRGTKALCPQGTTNGGQMERMHWLPIEELHEYRAFPAFLPRYLPNLPLQPVHIVSHHEQTGEKQREKQ